jgi:hypothetical protein
MRDAIEFLVIVSAVTGAAAVVVWLTFGFGCGSFGVRDWPDGARLASALIVGAIGALIFLGALLSIGDRAP